MKFNFQKMLKQRSRWFSVAFLVVAAPLVFAASANFSPTQILFKGGSKWIFNSAANVFHPNVRVALQNGIVLDDYIGSSDGSGTTAVFTDYLSKVSTTFAKTVGSGKVVKWAGNTTGGKGNAGVAAFVKQLDGGIGYVEYAYVKQNKMTYTKLKNNKGKTVEPDDTTFAQSAKSANWNVPGMAANLNNLDGWPITSATFVIVYKGSDKSVPVVKFFDWAYSKGDTIATELDYVPLPGQVKSLIRAKWAKEVK